IVNDVIDNMILQYDKLKNSFVDYLKVKQSLNFYSQGLFERQNINEIIASVIKETKESSDNKIMNNFITETKQEIWHNILSKTKVEKYMTNHVRKNFSAFSSQQGYMDFTKENVFNL